MPFPEPWFPRARFRYSQLETIEMADHTPTTANAHEESVKGASNKRGYSHDLASGELDVDRPSLEKRLPQYDQRGRDSLSTLGGASEPEDVTDEELATLRRVSDRIPLSAW